MENLIINIIADGTSGWTDDKTTPEKESLNDIIIRSFKETVNDLVMEIGPNTADWHWGKLHLFTISHPLGAVKTLDYALHLNHGPFELPGSFHTVCAYGYSYNNLYKVNHGPSQRHVFDTQNWDASETVIPTGTSGIPASKFYLDQTALYINNQYHADPFSRKEVEKAAKFKMKIAPETNE